MIKTFRHKGLERFFLHDDARGINPQFVKKLNSRLTALDAGASPEAMNLPGYRLHPLKGERAGQWAVWVSGNWRLVFAFDDTNAIDVDLIDYH